MFEDREIGSPKNSSVHPDERVKGGSYAMTAFRRCCTRYGVASLASARPVLLFGDFSFGALASLSVTEVLTR